MDAFLRKTNNGLSLLVPEIFEAWPGVRAGFSTRFGGVSPAPMDSLNFGRSLGDREENLQENYRRLAGFFGVKLSDLFIADQIHSSDILHVKADFTRKGLEKCPGFESDGLISCVPGTLLVTQHADCTPVFFYDPVSRSVGLAHSGWRGTAKQIASKTVCEMGRVFGTRPENLICAIGPRIGMCCFETDGDVPAGILSAMPWLDEKCFVRSDNGKYHVDLGNIISSDLQNAGVKAEHIALSDFCTCCRSDLFFSHRRMGRRRGTMAAAIMLSSEE